MRILFIGDVVGRPGRRCVRELVPGLRARHGVDLVIANGENAAGGLGATPETLDELFRGGVHLVTLGNHTWRKKQLAPALDMYDNVLRPANYPQGVPGRGSQVYVLPDGRKAGVINLLGRVYMEPVACPFEVGLREATRMREMTPVVIVDFHAEATSEKVAMGWHLDGACTAVIGTHTHVQTADERVLPRGTAYITDAGMTGPMDSVIGMERDIIIRKFLTGMPSEFKVAEDRPGLCGVVVEADDRTGAALSIERVCALDEGRG
ncbi:MAG TPA: TIGR00282 family metallophosphoesterase [Candidatus Hydrogenedentes bacterium]|nr:TIGR00282 family metallophosphoesterase [Candidatus Hydrogenedentota bacterium]